KKEMEKKGIAGGADALKAQVFLDCLGGPDNIQEVTNCATRLRVTVNDPDKVAGTSKFTNAGAFGLVKNGRAVQVIVGLSVPNVRSHFDALLKGDYTPMAETSPEDMKETTVDNPREVPVNAVASVDEDSRSMRLKAFVSGDLVDISEVPDDAFSQMMMGDGVAIKPTSDTIVAPADCVVSMIMESSLHAVGLELSNGAEILIHIGLDTVNLNGQGFTLLTEQDAQVKAGDPLIRFDRDVIAKAGYDDIVIMAVTNSPEYPQMKKEPDQPVVAGETPIVIF
ncbi:MAG: glucose PTS transporter subunit IIA, partial [Megasphaera sp.]|nr:glucose PTS transporter subunit IIA [Megasphaera sp.]